VEPALCQPKPIISTGDYLLIPESFKRIVLSSNIKSSYIVKRLFQGSDSFSTVHCSLNQWFLRGNQESGLCRLGKDRLLGSIGRGKESVGHGRT